MYVYVTGILLRGGISAERGQRLFRDQHGNGRGVHKDRIRSRKARSLRAGGRG